MSLVYVGAIVVLIIFGVLLTQEKEPAKLRKARKARLDRLREEGVESIEFVCGNALIPGPILTMDEMIENELIRGTIPTLWEIEEEESRLEAMERQLNRKLQPSTKKLHPLKKLLPFLFS
jgi:hypothetical protein